MFFKPKKFLLNCLPAPVLLVHVDELVGVGAVAEARPDVGQVPPVRAGLERDPPHPLVDQRREVLADVILGVIV